MTQELMQRLGIQSPETAEKVEQFLLALEERNRLLTEKSAALEREKTKGTGFQAAYTKKKTTKENEIAQTFRKALRR